MIENIKHFHAELDVEVLGDSANVIIFKDGEIQAGHTRANQSIAAGVAAQIVALQGRRIDRTAEARRSGAAVGIPKRSVRSCGDGEALRLDIIARITGIGKRSATRSAEAVRVSEIVAAQGVCRISARSPRGREGNAVAGGED